MYILNITKAIKRMSVNDIRDFIFENYYKRTEFSKESSCYSVKHLKKKDILLLVNKLLEKVTDPQKQKISKTIRNNYLSTKNPNIVTYKSVITEHPKTSHKLSKTITQTEKIGSNSSIVI